MSTIRTNKVWNGLNVIQETDLTTGIIRIYSRDTGSGRNKVSGTLLATGGANGAWIFNDEEEFRRVYNNAQRKQGKQALSEKDFKKEFNRSGIPLFNADRADILNNKDNYETTSDFEKFTAIFFRAGTPGVVNPERGIKNNSRGRAVRDPNKNRVQDESDFFLDVTPISSFKLRGSGSGGANLRYPLDRVPDLDYDFVTFTAYEYQAGGLTDIGNENRIGTPLETVTLPIVAGVEESNGVEWGEDRLNEIQRQGALIAMKTIGSENAGEAFSNLLSSTGDAAKQLLADPALKDGVAAYFAGQAVGANVLGRTQGAVLNPNLELLFKGPQLRSFNFNFKLRPRYEDEAEQIKNIIRAFKKNMHVQRDIGGTLFLQTPNVFKIQYYHKGGEHPFMNRLKPCALTNFKVNYTPDNNYMTYSDGSMTGFDISLSFSEIMPIYSDQIEEQGGTSY